MSKPTYEELEAKVEQLLTANDKLSKHIIGFGDMFEQNKRALMAHGWDACADKIASQSSAPCLHEYPLKEDNPFRKPVEVPGV